MKNLFFLLSAGVLITACGGEKSEYESAYDKDREVKTEPASTPATAQSNEPAAQEDEFARGIKLISMSDCLSCHQEDRKLIGPAYVDVAKKYELNDENLDYLAGKIIKGGSGVWGDIAMNPHPDLSQEEAREMAKYVLSLRETK